MTPKRFQELQAVLADCSFPGYTFELTLKGRIAFVNVRYDEPDVFTGVNETQRGRDWKIENNWDDMQVVQTAFKSLLTSLEHRARENFLYRRRPIMHPHRTLAEDYQQASAQERSQGFDMPEIEFEQTPTERAEQHAAFVRTLDDDVAKHRMTPAQRHDLLEQKALFDAALEANRQEHARQHIGYVAGEKLVVGSASSLIRMAKTKHPERQLYFEAMPHAALMFEEH